MTNLVDDLELYVYCSNFFIISENISSQFLIKIIELLIVVYATNRVFVRLGELDSRTNLCDNNRDLCSEPQDYEIESIVHHKNYDTPKYANDVALIRLQKTTNSSMQLKSRFKIAIYK